MVQFEITPLNHLERLCQDGRPVPADQHPAFIPLVTAGRWGMPSDATVARSRSIPSVLESGARKIITLEHIKEGASVLLRQNPEAALGSIATRIATDRLLEYRGRRTEEQLTYIRLHFSRSSIVKGDIGGNLPFDEIMEADTRDAWHASGLELVYENPEETGHFAFILLPDYMETIATTLAQME